MISSPQVDCTANERLCSGEPWNVRAYPTMYLRRRGKTLLYEGAPEKRPIVEFMRRVTQLSPKVRIERQRLAQGSIVDTCMGDLLCRFHCSYGVRPYRTEAGAACKFSQLSGIEAKNQSSQRVCLHLRHWYIGRYTRDDGLSKLRAKSAAEFGVPKTRLLLRGVIKWQRLRARWWRMYVYTVAARWRNLYLSGVCNIYCIITACRAQNDGPF